LRIGLLYGNPSATFNSEFLVDLLEESGRIGCQLIVEKCLNARNSRTAARRLFKKGIDGVLLPTPLCDSLPLLRYFETTGIVYVSVGTGGERLPGLSLRIDNARAAEEMTHHLLALGHRNIGFIRGHPRQIDSAQRYEGFITALASAGLSVRPQWVKQGQYTFKSGFLAAHELLKPRNRPSAIFASNDDMAAGALAAAHRLKLTVPLDLSIVGFDDTPLATSIWPSLTTIRQPIGEITRLALSMAVEEVRQRRRGRSPSQRQETVQLHLIQRESASAPGSALSSLR
jgi:LacI family transcriptional regulator